MPTTSAGSRSSDLRREVDHVGEQDRRRAELVGDRLRADLQPVGDRARQDVQEQVLGSCLLRSERGQGRRGAAGEQREQGEDDRAADGHVEGEHRGREPGRDRRWDRAEDTPAVPEPRKMTSQATNQRVADRTSLNTSAPSGARMPHRPTPPAPRKPPSGIIESVGASRMSSWFTRSSRAKSRVRENTRDRSEPGPRSTRTARSRPATRTRGRGRPRRARSAGSAQRSGRGAPCSSGCPRRRADRRRSAPPGRARHRRRSGCDAPGSRRRRYSWDRRACISAAAARVTGLQRSEDAAPNRSREGAPDRRLVARQNPRLAPDKRPQVAT